MGEFKQAYAETFKVEGGYSNNKKDPGGETWRGIARTKHPQWVGWVIVDSLRKQKDFPGNLALSQPLQYQVLTFYRTEFWDRLLLDQVKTQKIANKLYDIAVNTGVVTAGRFLQKALNVLNQNGKYYADLKPDGQVGNKTITALNSHPRQDVVFKALNVLQGSYYISISENNDQLESFINGWFEQRVAAVDMPDKNNDIA